jgi:hypothetical protein
MSNLTNRLVGFVIFACAKILKEINQSKKILVFDLFLFEQLKHFKRAKFGT